MQKGGMKRIAAWLLLVCMMAALLAGCSGSKTEQTNPAPSASSETAQTPEQTTQTPEEEVKTVKVAAAFPMSGSSAELGMMCHDGLEMAINDINEAGGIQSLGGAKIEVVWADTTSDPAQAKSVVERLVADDEIICFFGTGASSVMMPILPILEKNQIPAITNAGSAAVTQQGNHYVFQVPHSTDLAGQNIVKFIQWLNENGYSYQKVGLVYENSTFGIDMAEGSRQDAEEYGLDIVFDESFPAGLTDASAIVTAMKNTGAEVFLPATYASESKLFIDTMKNLDYHPLVIGPVAWPSLKEGLGDAVNGVISTGSWSWNTKNVAENPVNADIVKRFEETYGYFMTEQAGPNYVCAQVLQAALEASAATTREELRDAIASVKLEDCLICPGELEFDENGKNIKAVAVCHQWQDGVPCAIFPREYAVSDYIDPSEMN